MGKPGRKPNVDRLHTTEERGKMVAVRLSPVEEQALHALVLQRQREVSRLMGDAITTATPAVEVSSAAMMRTLLRQAAMSAGVWDEAEHRAAASVTISSVPAQQTLVATIEPSVARQPYTIEPSTIRQYENASAGMTFVPTLVEALVASGVGVADIHTALRAGDRAGAWELRPESGMGRLSKDEKSKCVTSEAGLLSWVRLLDARVSSSTPTPRKQNTDPDALRSRVALAIKKGQWANKSAFGKALSPRIGLAEPSAIAWAGRFLGGDNPTDPKRLAALEDALREVGG